MELSCTQDRFQCCSMVQEVGRLSFRPYSCRKVEVERTGQDLAIVRETGNRKSKTRNKATLESISRKKYESREMCQRVSVLDSS